MRSHDAIFSAGQCSGVPESARPSKDEGDRGAGFQIMLCYNLPLYEAIHGHTGAHAAFGCAVGGIVSLNMRDHPATAMQYAMLLMAVLAGTDANDPSLACVCIVTNFCFCEQQYSE